MPRSKAEEITPTPLERSVPVWCQSLGRGVVTSTDGDMCSVKFGGRSIHKRGWATLCVDITDLQGFGYLVRLLAPWADTPNGPDSEDVQAWLSSYGASRVHASERQQVKEAITRVYGGAA